MTSPKRDGAAEYLSAVNVKRTDTEAYEFNFNGVNEDGEEKKK